MGSYKSDQRNAKFYGLKLSRNTDAAMIQWLDSQESVQGYLKGIIKDDMIKGEKNMKIWYIVDNRNGDIWTESTHTADEATAKSIATREWKALSSHDKKLRKEFYITLAETDEDGLLDWNTTTKTVDIMKEESTMKKSEIIRENLKDISEAMIERYRIVLKCHGQVQYKIYIWEDGEIECLEGPQGDNTRLAPRQNETRNLYYVTTVDHPFFDPWDLADHSAPDDDAEREAEEAEIIDWCVDSYEEALPDKLDAIIAEAEDEEMDD